MSDSLGNLAAAFLLGVFVGMLAGVAASCVIHEKRRAARKNKQNQQKTGRQQDNGRRRQASKHAQGQGNTTPTGRSAGASNHSAKRKKANGAMLSIVVRELCKKLWACWRQFSMQIKGIFPQEAAVRQPNPLREGKSTSSKALSPSKGIKPRQVNTNAARKGVDTPPKLKNPAPINNNTKTEKQDLCQMANTDNIVPVKNISVKKSRTMKETPVLDSGSAELAPTPALVTEVPQTSRKEQAKCSAKPDFSAFSAELGAEFDEVLSTDIYLHRGTGYAWNPATDEVVPDEKARMGYYTLQHIARNGMLRLFDVVINDEVIDYSMYAANEKIRRNDEYYQIASVERAARIKANSAIDYYSLEKPGTLVFRSI